MTNVEGRYGLHCISIYLLFSFCKKYSSITKLLKNKHFTYDQKNGLI